MSRAWGGPCCGLDRERVHARSFTSPPPPTPPHPLLCAAPSPLNIQIVRRPLTLPSCTHSPPSTPTGPFFSLPIFSLGFEATRHHWNYYTTGQKNLTMEGSHWDSGEGRAYRPLIQCRGKVLGGCSSINISNYVRVTAPSPNPNPSHNAPITLDAAPRRVHMHRPTRGAVKCFVPPAFTHSLRSFAHPQQTRGHTGDYDAWEAAGNRGWGSKDVAGAFDKLESSYGPLSIQERPPNPIGVSKAFLGRYPVGAR